jgi:hypothetical protein
MKVSVKLEGLKELEANMAALIAAGDISKGQARSALKRTLIEAGQPMAERIRQLVPVRTGKLRDSIKVLASFRNKVRDDAFSKAKKAGLDNAAAGLAARDAQRAAKASKSTVEVYVGPLSNRSRLGHLIEFGTKPHRIRAKKTKSGKLSVWGGAPASVVARVAEVDHPGARAQPFMRPGFEGAAPGVLAAITEAMRGQLAAAVSRAAKTRARNAAKAAR